MNGPRAPKDPVKRRAAVYVMVDSVIEGSPRENGKYQDICYLNGRIAQKIRVLCNEMPQELLEALPTSEGFRKVVHSIGVTVVATEEQKRTEFVRFELNCLSRQEGKNGSCYGAEVPCNGEEVKILLSEYPINPWDDLLGSFVTSFSAHDTAKLTVCFYLNDGYRAPELRFDPPVAFDSDGYREMVARSLVQTGNLFRIQKAIDKARRGETVVLAYLGGSITQGAGAKPIHTMSYAYRSFCAFKRRFGKGNGENVRFVKAGAGGTCSELGLTRYDKDVLREGTITPDILFLEYAVNDAGDETEGVCFESLVRMAAEGPGNPGVILLFAVFMNDWNLQERMIPVGRRFALPMISIRDAVVPQFSREKPVITKRQFFYDLFHPSNEGHRVMADCIDYFWEQVQRADGEGKEHIPDVLPAIGDRFHRLHTFDRSNYEKHLWVKELFPGVFTSTDKELQCVERDEDIKATPEFPDNWKKEPGSVGEPFRLRLFCKDVLLVYKDTADVKFGKAQVKVDGQVVKTINPLEIGWNHCTAYIVYESDKAQEHRIEISMEEEDAEKGFTILGFGYTTE